MLPTDKFHNLRGEGNDDAGQDEQQSLTALGRVVALKAHAEHDKAQQQDQPADGGDNAADKAAEIAEHLVHFIDTGTGGINRHTVEKKNGGHKDRRNGFLDSFYQLTYFQILNPFYPFLYMDGLRGF